MSEFWEQAFIKNQTMWGLQPCQSAVIANTYFTKEKLNKILIPGFGYGRNAKLFVDNGRQVTGIEISKTAIDLAQKHFASNLKIYHGSVTQMPFDDQMCDGVFCYGLLYLLDKLARIKLIQDCYSQLNIGGSMIFSVLSSSSPNYGVGKELGKNWFATVHGVQIFFYDTESIKLEFGKYGLFDYVEIDEPNQNSPDKPPFKFWLITCKK